MYYTLARTRFIYTYYINCVRPKKEIFTADYIVIPLDPLAAATTTGKVFIFFSSAAV